MATCDENDPAKMLSFVGQVLINASLQGQCHNPIPTIISDYHIKFETSKDYTAILGASDLKTYTRLIVIGYKDLG